MGSEPSHAIFLIIQEVVPECRVNEAGRGTDRCYPRCSVDKSEADDAVGAKQNGFDGTGDELLTILTATSVSVASSTVTSQ